MIIGSFKIKKYYFLLLFLAFCMETVTVFAQNKIKLSVEEDSISMILENAIYKIEYEYDIERAGELIFDVENYVISNDNLYLKGLLSTSKALFSFGTYNFIDVKKNIDDAINYYGRIDDKDGLAYSYEILGAYWSYYNNLDKTKKAYLLSENYYKETEGESKKIDIYYNLCITFYREEEWVKSINYGKKALKIIQFTSEKKDRQTYLHDQIGKCYLRLSDHKKAKFHFDKSLNEIKTVESKAYSYWATAQYYEAIGDVKNAYKYFKLSNVFFLKDIDRTSLKIRRRLTLKNEIDNEVLVKKRVLVERKLNREKLKFNKYLVLTSGTFILGLLVLSVIQVRNAKFKTKSNNLLVIKNKALFKAKNDALNASELKSDFIERVTHELKTPLNTITTISYLLKKENKKGDSEFIGYLEGIDMSSKSLLNFINNAIGLNLLTKNNKVVLNERSFNINTVLTGIIGTLNTEQSNVKFELFFDDKIPILVNGDELKFVNMFISLLTNISDYSKSDTVSVYVDLQLKTEDSIAIVFTIKEKSRSESIINKTMSFSELTNDGLKQDDKLSIDFSIDAKNILDLDGSGMLVETDVYDSIKLTFTILFNEVKEVYVPLEVKLLLAEDNKINQLLTQKVLINNGFSCDVANNGVEAVEMCRTKNYDLILMDIMMPTMDGYEATKEIRVFNSHIPILALTALSKEENKQSFEESGIDVVLNKPINPDLMFKFIFKALAFGKKQIV